MRRFIDFALVSVAFSMTAFMAFVHFRLAVSGEFRYYEPNKVIAVTEVILLTLVCLGLVRLLVRWVLLIALSFMEVREKDTRR